MQCPSLLLLVNFAILDTMGIKMQALQLFIQGADNLHKRRLLSVENDVASL
ncbi:hypothetical protein M378DRAFT_284333 [Amanita muscaria Koide BX008]|uniref:Uncharacterized protein n=1 Tax=Amanita muscaria (strain Koide BX008) TaxID=946122 RepID=A0A0C2WCL4_AMAMK|nr:hypothetical protein M378DRAFT_284333 [Amanita muscaria Koide BX008]